MEFKNYEDALANLKDEIERLNQYIEELKVENKRWKLERDKYYRICIQNGYDDTKLIAKDLRKAISKGRGKGFNSGEEFYQYFETLADRLENLDER